MAHPPARFGGQKSDFLNLKRVGYESNLVAVACCRVKTRSAKFRNGCRIVSERPDPLSIKVDLFPSYRFIILAPEGCGLSSRKEHGFPLMGMSMFVFLLCRLLLLCQSRGFADNFVLGGRNWSGWFQLSSRFKFHSLVLFLVSVAELDPISSFAL